MSSFAHITPGSIWRDGRRLLFVTAVDADGVHLLITNRYGQHWRTQRCPSEPSRFAPPGTDPLNILLARLYERVERLPADAPALPEHTLRRMRGAAGSGS